MHPLLTMFLAAADGCFPPVDGGVSIVPTWRAGLAAIVAFTGHAVIAADADAATLKALGADGYGGALHPRVQAHVAGANGSIGVIDATLVGRGLGGGSGLGLRADLDGHPRVVYARKIRDDVRVVGDERGFVTFARGIAGRHELSVEAADDGQGRGWGRSLVAEALRDVPEGEPIFAAVAPGNARSLRAFLGLGFTPIGSELVLLTDQIDPALR